MKTSETRAKILATAGRLFFQQGYNATGVNQIIKEADVAIGSLYNHFPSKNDLLSSYILQAGEIWFAELDTFLKPIKNPRDRLLALFDYRIDRQQRSDFGGCQFTKVSAELPRKDVVTLQLVRLQKDRLKDLITELIKKSELTGNNGLTSEMLAEAIFLLLEGATVSANVYKDIAPINAARSVAEKMLG